MLSFYFEEKPLKKAKKGLLFIYFIGIIYLGLTGLDVRGC